MPDILDIKKTFLPADVRALSINKVDNFALKFNKAAFYKLENNKYKFLFRDSGNEIVPDFGHVNWAAITSRQKSAAKSLFGERHANFTASPEWRMVIGISGGGTSVYETGMTLHHVYGIPYIPSSSLKGIVRSWLILELFGGDEDLAKNNELFADLFGSDDKGYREQQGNIIFMDAYPLEKPKLEVDIMNPHYQHWYAEGQQPHDAGKPIPIPFLTVAHPTKFQIILGAVKDIRCQESFTNTAHFKIFIPENSGLSSKSSLLEIAAYWTKQALTERGIGAKTAVGYGYMKTQEQPSPAEPSTNPQPNPQPNPRPPINLTEGLEIEVEVAEVQNIGLVKTKHPNNPLQMVTIQDAPRDLKVGDVVIAKCRLNRNQKLERLIFVRLK